MVIGIHLLLKLYVELKRWYRYGIGMERDTAMGQVEVSSFTRVPTRRRRGCFIGSNIYLFKVMYVEALKRGGVGASRTMRGTRGESTRGRDSRVYPLRVESARCTSISGSVFSEGLWVLCSPRRVHGVYSLMRGAFPVSTGGVSLVWCQHENSG